MKMINLNSEIVSQHKCICRIIFFFIIDSNRLTMVTAVHLWKVRRLSSTFSFFVHESFRPNWYCWNFRFLNESNGIRAMILLYQPLGDAQNQRKSAFSSTNSFNENNANIQQHKSFCLFWMKWTESFTSRNSMQVSEFSSKTFWFSFLLLLYCIYI